MFYCRFSHFCMETLDWPAHVDSQWKILQRKKSIQSIFSGSHLWHQVLHHHQMNYTTPPPSKICKGDARLESGSSHASQNIFCSVTLTRAWVRAEKSAPWTECYVIISTSNSIPLLSNREVLMAHPFGGQSFIICTYSDRQNMRHAT